MSQLSDVLYLLYAYQQDDTDKLARKLTERRRATWINQLTDLARQHGCSRYAGTPKGQDARELARLSQLDAESIANTFNRQLRAEIERIYADNPRANRNTYFARLEAWAAKRDKHKSLTIALQTDSTARNYARTRFWGMNRLDGGQFIMRGAPAVCRECLTIMGMGVLTFDFIRSRPCPRHINCTHQYEMVRPPKLDCATLWLG